ncbi:unnamed protein product [Discula destructiva]
MPTFGVYLVSLLTVSAELQLASALPQSMDIVSPSIHLLESGTFSLSVRSNIDKRDHTQEHGHAALAYVKAIRKYNAVVPSHLQDIVDRAALAKRAGSLSGSWEVDPVAFDSEYVANVSIGTPPQELVLGVDTGLADFWAIGSGVGGTAGRATYNPLDSSTAKQLEGEFWSVEYADKSSSSGVVYMDKVTLGNLTVPSQAVGVATILSDEFTSDTAVSGLVGLAMSSRSTVDPTPQKTWFDNIKASLLSPLFTVNLKHDAAGGSLNFGYIDVTKYNGLIFYSKVVDTGVFAGLWAFTADGYMVRDHAARSITKERSIARPNTPITGVVDTGTTLLLLPEDVVSAYYSQVKGATMNTKEGGYVFACDLKLPDFLFEIGGGIISIPGHYINWRPIIPGSELCFGGIQSDAPIGVSIFGGIALKSAFVVLDSGESRVGWAAKDL